MAGISNFKIAMRSGPLRQNRWEIAFNFPTGVGTIATAANGALLARTADVPDSTIGEILIPWRGKDFPWPGDRTVAEYPITFVAVQDMLLHDAFMQWKDRLVSFEDNVQTGSFPDLVVDIKMTLLDVRDQPIRTYILEDAWPREITAIAGDMSAKDAHSEFSVTFRYLTPKMISPAAGTTT